VNKKKQKNFIHSDRAGETTRDPDQQKFFASFLQKRSAAFPH
jgi:hypothetical protein